MQHSFKTIFIRSNVHMLQRYIQITNSLVLSKKAIWWEDYSNLLDNRLSPPFTLYGRLSHIKLISQFRPKRHCHLQHTAQLGKTKSFIVFSVAATTRHTHSPKNYFLKWWFSFWIMFNNPCYSPIKRTVTHRLCLQADWQVARIIGF